jgi:hypothetical protein
VFFHSGCFTAGRLQTSCDRIALPLRRAAWSEEGELMENLKKWLKRAVNNEKDGKEILAELRKDAADGEEDAKAILKLIGK